MSELPSKSEMLFDALWEEMFPDIDLETEQKLIEGRKFKYDYYHCEAKIAIEINGAVYGTTDWMGERKPSGHTSAKGIQRDYEKINLAANLGIYVFCLSTEMINERWLGLIAETIKQKVQKI